MFKKLLLILLLFGSYCLAGNSLFAQVYLQENFDVAFSGSPAAPLGWKQTRIQIFGDEKPVPNGIVGSKDWAQNKFVNSTWLYSNSFSWDPNSTNNNGVLWLEDALFGSQANSMARRIESPAINLSNSSSPFIIFQYFNASAADTSFPLILVFSTDNGSTWKPLMHVQANASEKTLSNQTSAAVNANSPWSKIYIPIPSNLKLTQVKFGFQKNASYNQIANIFIDSFSIEEFLPVTISSKKSGLWSNPDTWGGIVPTCQNNVTISSGHTVEIDVNIARTQQLNIAGKLQFYSNISTQVLQCFGDIIVQTNGTYSTNTATNTTLSRSTYIGGNLVVNGNYVSNANNANSIYMSGAQLYSISGTGSFSNNGIARLYVQNAEGIKIDMPFAVTYALYLIEGNCNPNGKLSVGSLAAASNVTLVKNGRSNFTQKPIFPSLGTYTRNVFYGGICNGNMPSAMLNSDTIYTGYECDSSNGNEAIILGNLSVNTSGIVQLKSNLKIGNATIGGNLSLMRGIIISSNAKLLIIGPLGNGHIGVEPSKTKPFTTQGSYVYGPVRFDRASNNANTIYVPLGLGSDGIYSANFNNQLKTIQLNPGTNWNSQSITFSCFTQTSGSVDTGLTAMATDKAYYVNLNGGNDLSASATIAIRGMNANSLFSDKLNGQNNQVFVGQSVNVSGSVWKRRGNTFTGTGLNFELNQQYTFYSANSGNYGPIAPLATKGNYFSLLTNASNGTLVSTLVTKNSDAIAAGTKNALLCKLTVTCGGQIPLQLNQLSFNLNGTNKLTNLQSIKIMYGASDSSIGNAKQFGNTLTTMNSNNSIAGNMQLVSGVNYFWILADIQSSAIAGDSIGLNLSSLNFTTFNVTSFSNPIAFKKIGTALSLMALLQTEKKSTLVSQNSFDNVLIKIPIKMSSIGAAVSLNKFVFETSNKALNSWQKIKQVSLYYSGNQITYSKYNKIGSVLNPDSIFEFSIPVQLCKDTNYFWILADIEKYAPTNDSISIACKSIEINSTNYYYNPQTNYFNIKNGYPISSALSNTDEEIWGVSIGSLNNQSDCNSIGSYNSVANMYNDYTTLNAPSLVKGNSYSITLNLGSCAANNLSNAAVYIDYNQNNSFDDDGELVYCTGVHNSNNLGQQFIGNILIPVYIKAGNTRMRIVYAEQTTIPAAKGYYFNGETEDYLVSILDVPYQSYTWNGSISKNYQTANNWTPNRISPNFNDKLIFNKGSFILDSIKTEKIRCLEFKDSCKLTIINKTAQTLSIFDSLILNQQVAIQSNENLVFEIGIDTVQTGVINYNNAGIYGTIKRWFNKKNNNLVFPFIDTNSIVHFASIQLFPTPYKFGAITCNFKQSPIALNGIPFQSEQITVNKIYPNGIWTLGSSNLLNGTLFALEFKVNNLLGIYNCNNLCMAYRSSTTGDWSQNGKNSSTNSIVENTTFIHSTDNYQFGQFVIATDSNSNNFSNQTYATTHCFLQGLYKGDGVQNSALKATGLTNLAQYADSLTINFWEPSTPMNLLYSAKTLVDTLGIGYMAIPQFLHQKLCYWEIKHRNSIATWSQEPILMAEANTIYDFTYGDFTAYGNNLFDNGDGFFSIYGGDVNQDGFVDGNDFIDVDNDNALFYSGYKETDINGDGFVDGNDFILIDNNNSLFIGTIQP